MTNFNGRVEVRTIYPRRSACGNNVLGAASTT